MELGLAGKRAVVTGASKGIGRASPLARRRRPVQGQSLGA